MIEFTSILQNATSAIGSMYFHVNIDGGNPIFRERVYCYELYHQMRKQWPENSTYFLNGELDKRAHPILKELGADNLMPDLLIHTPGNMTGNYAVIEVKHSMSKKGVFKDLATFDILIRKVEYRRAIYLIYGNDANMLNLDKIRNIAGEFENLVPVEIWFHKNFYSPAAHYATLSVQNFKVNRLMA